MKKLLIIACLLCSLTSHSQFKIVANSISMTISDLTSSSFIHTSTAYSYGVWGNDLRMVGFGTQTYTFPPADIDSINGVSSAGFTTASIIHVLDSIIAVAPSSTDPAALSTNTTMSTTLDTVQRNGINTVLQLATNAATLTGTVILPSTTSIGTVSNTEISYVDGVTSAIQTQMDLKAPKASATFTGTTITALLTPTTNNTNDFGSTSVRWKDSYFSGVSNLRKQINIATVTTDVVSIFRGMASQSGDLTQWQTSAPATVASISAAGNFTATNYLSGTYTPTFSNEANIDGAAIPSDWHYSRIGNIVTYTGQFTVDPLLVATVTSFEFTLPIASAIADPDEVGGVAFCGAIAGMGAQIEGDAANNTGKIFWISTDLASQTWSVTGTYLIQ